jgi:uncharacterized repeat protein (TIGR02543 family)
LLTVAASPAAGGSISPSPSSADGFYSAGTVVDLVAYAATDYAFTGWSGAATGTANPTTVTMSAPRSVTALFSKISAVDVTVAETPLTSALLPNFPNPCNPSTRIGYRLPGAREVRLEVVDMLGRKIATLVEGRREAGNHEVWLDATGIPSGVYFYRIQTGDFTSARRMMVVK